MCSIMNSCEADSLNSKSTLPDCKMLVKAVASHKSSDLDFFFFFCTPVYVKNRFDSASPHSEFRFHKEAGLDNPLT